MTIDEIIDKLPMRRRAKVRQRVLALIAEEQEGPKSQPANIISMKRIREKKRNGK